MRTTKTPGSSAGSTDNGTLPPTAVFELLAHDRRRYILQYLSQKVGAVSLSELTEQIAIWEDKPTYDQYERILTGLHHQQLPKLGDAGIIRYDVDAETITLLETVDQLTPYLQLAMPDDLAMSDESDDT
ncbi:DUF7344 domain-containing protein [Haladaptatus halobius]|uniref:DUF7344 domain-containing protein n=1 Tax=Haladaptatus halobius TaxID=2884875 RepID=UPI001D0B9AB5|nr:hypothetical protein [Haladaptatus halobius]